MTVFKRCAIVMTNDSVISSRMVCWICTHDLHQRSSAEDLAQTLSSVARSIELEASSSIVKRACRSIARANANNWRSPAEKLDPAGLTGCARLRMTERRV